MVNIVVVSAQGSPGWGAALVLARLGHQVVLVESAESWRRMIGLSAAHVWPLPAARVL
jgi:hypothetical protein